LLTCWEDETSTAFADGNALWSVDALQMQLVTNIF
jgi:hypothetical protein